MATLKRIFQTFSAHGIHSLQLYKLSRHLKLSLLKIVRSGGFPYCPTSTVPFSRLSLVFGQTLAGKNRSPQISTEHVNIKKSKTSFISWWLSTDMFTFIIYNLYLFHVTRGVLLGASTRVSHRYLSLPDASEDLQSNCWKRWIKWYPEGWRWKVWPRRWWIWSMVVVDHMYSLTLKFHP